jgi:hypothetical protein
MNNDEEREHFREKYAPSAKLSLDEEWTQHNISERIIKGCAKGDSFSMACVNFDDWVLDKFIESLRTDVDSKKFVNASVEARADQLFDDICIEAWPTMLPAKMHIGKSNEWWEYSTFLPFSAIEHLNHYLPQISDFLEEKLNEN